MMMKDYQDLIGRIIIAAAIVIAGLLIAQAINGAGSQISVSYTHLDVYKRQAIYCWRRIA